MTNQYTEWPSLRAKIEARLDTTSSPEGCWLWTGAKQRLGYGNVRWGAKFYRVHRAYLIELGIEVPDDMDIDHLCGVKSCANPAHLEVVTHVENLRRSPTTLTTINAAKTHCLHGHPFDEANTGKTKDGKRRCRACARERMRAARDPNAKAVNA